MITQTAQQTIFISGIYLTISCRVFQLVGILKILLSMRTLIYLTTGLIYYQKVHLRTFLFMKICEYKNIFILQCFIYGRAVASMFGFHTGCHGFDCHRQHMHFSSPVDQGLCTWYALGWKEWYLDGGQCLQCC